MSVPRELELRTTRAGLRLVQRPVRELARLRGQQHRFGEGTFDDANTWLKGRRLEGDLLEIEAEFASVRDAEMFGLKLVTGPQEETIVGCHSAEARLFIDRTRSGKTDFHGKFPGIHKAPLRHRDGNITLHALVDTSSIEVFGNDGETVLTDLILPTSGSRKLELFFSGKPPQVKKLHVWELNSAWR